MRGKRYSPVGKLYVRPELSVTVLPVTMVDGKLEMPSSPNTSVGVPVSASTTVTLVPLTGTPSALLKATPNGSTKTLKLLAAKGCPAFWSKALSVSVSPGRTDNWQSPDTPGGGEGMVAMIPKK